jgi:hypothetical protein
MPDVAASMRRACVTLVKELAAKYNKQFIEADSARRMIEKARLDTANEIIAVLESVSIQEQEAKQS